MKRIALALGLLLASTQARAQTAIGATCSSRPVLCDINPTLPGKVVIASSSPSSDCSAQTVIVTVNSGSKTLTYGTDFTGGTKLAACNSLAAAILPITGIKNAYCAADGATVYVFPFREQVQYWNMVSSSGSCATTTLPNAGQVQIGSTIFTNNGNGVLGLNQLNGSTAAAVTVGALTASAVTATTLTPSGLLSANGGLVCPSNIDTATGSSITSATSCGLYVANASTDAATTWVLPAATTGASFCFSQGASSLGSNREVDVATPTGTDYIVGTTTPAGGTGIATTAGASHGIKNTHATAVRGNMTCLKADGVGIWYMTAISGVWAAF